MKNKDMTIEEAVKEMMELFPVNKDTGHKKDSDRKEGKILSNS